MGTTAHDLSDLLDSYGGKTCFIGRNPSSYVHDKCTMVCFDNETSKLAAISSVSVYKGVNLHWAGLFLACCAKCKQFDHISDVSFVRSDFRNFKKIELCGIGANVIAILYSPPFVASPLDLALNSDMAVNSVVVLFSPSLPVVDNAISILSLSSLKVLTTKMDSLELKMIALEVSFNLENCYLQCLGFDDVHVFISDIDSGNLGSGIAIIMDIFLAHHVCKISKVSGWLLFVRLLFKNKLSVLILGLYVGASSSVQFFQADKINFIIAKAVNESSFVVLKGDFNKNSSHKCASFKKCLDFGLINSLSESSFVKTITWANSHGMAKIINFLFVSSNLVNTVMDCNVYNAVSVSNNFGNAISANMAMFSDKFATTMKFLDLNALWDIICKIIVLSTNKVFKKKWFKKFDNIFTKKSSRFYKLELLVSRIVKTFRKKSVDVVDSGTSPDHVCSAFFGAKKYYCTCKLAESLRAKKINIKTAIDKRIESFKVNKSHIIRSVLKCPFCKVVFNHLVFENKLILDPNLVKSKHWMVDNVFGDWCYQYLPLKYVFDGAFSSIMCSIEFNKLFGMVFFLSDGKAAGLSAHKILSKILSDRISLAYSTFDVLCENNFSVLKGTMIQSPIFVIGLVVKDALKKNWELWLVLQDMWKTYNSVGSILRGV
ncbi:hypothetical protein G9A89_023929 [Geosiphon pyriformis]|nr:hypothetical protein G9A89_023929 [Geosiphon pyriformis]